MNHIIILNSCLYCSNIEKNKLTNQNSKKKKSKNQSALGLKSGLKISFLLLF